MKRVKTKSIYETKTPKWMIERKYYKAFNKIASYNSPLLKHELTRKRRKVVRIE